MGLRPLEIVFSYSAGIDFRRLNLTSVDVRFAVCSGWRFLSIGKFMLEMLIQDQQHNESHAVLIYSNTFRIDHNDSR